MKARKRTNTDSSQPPHELHDRDLKSCYQRAPAAGMFPSQEFCWGRRPRALLIQDWPSGTWGKWVAAGIREKRKCPLHPLLQRRLKCSHLCEVKTLCWIELCLHHSDRGWQHWESTGGQRVRVYDIEHTCNTIGWSPSTPLNLSNWNRKIVGHSKNKPQTT